jgi:hypothetical protein
MMSWRTEEGRTGKVQTKHSFPFRSCSALAAKAISFASIADQKPHFGMQDYFMPFFCLSLLCLDVGFTDLNRRKKVFREAPYPKTKMAEVFREAPYPKTKMAAAV